MIVLLRGKYKRQDFEYLEGILDTVLNNTQLCNHVCFNCENRLACKDLHCLHKYICEVLKNEKN